MWRNKGIMGGKPEGIGSIIGRHKIDRGRLRIVKEMEKPKNLHVRPMDMNKGAGRVLEGGGMWGRGWDKGKKKIGTTETT